MLENHILKYYVQILLFYDSFLNFPKKSSISCFVPAHKLNISSKYCEYNIDLFLMCRYTQCLTSTFHCFVNMCWLAFTRSWEYDSISVYFLWDAVLYGLKLYKHVKLIWYYHVEFVFWWKSWWKYGIFMNIFLKNVIMKIYLLWIFKYFNIFMFSSRSQVEYTWL